MRRMVLLFTLMTMPMPVAAQGRWEIEIHAGGALVNHPADGVSVLPAAAATFTAATGTPTRHESSWLFGDGAALVNQVNTARGLSARIVSLDPILTTAVAERQNGGTFGVRIGRHLAARYMAEFAFDYTSSSLRLSDAALAGIEASRASFTSAFSVPLPAGAQGQAPVMTATSTATIDQPNGHQFLTTGALTIDLATASRVIPYVSAGGGLAVDSADAPVATIVGNYRIAGPPGSQLAGVTVHNETDTVTLRYAVDRRAFVGLVGGGIKYVVTPKWGLRVDARAFLGRNGVTNLVDARPVVATLTPPTVLALPVNPTLQFSNNAATGAQSSLSGLALNGFESFVGSGIQVRVHVVAGVFWRF